MNALEFIAFHELATRITSPDRKMINWHLTSYNVRIVFQNSIYSLMRTLLMLVYIFQDRRKENNYHDNYYVRAKRDKKYLPFKDGNTCPLSLETEKRLFAQVSRMAARG